MDYDNTITRNGDQHYLLDGRDGLEGSPSKDAFCRWHKSLNPKFWATDFDLVLVRRAPFDIVAVLDFKEKTSDQRLDSLRFTHAVAYQTIKSFGIPVFIIQAIWQPGSIPEFNSFSIYELVEANPLPNPPECEFALIMDGGSAEDFEQWELGLRQNHKPRNNQDDYKDLLIRIRDNCNKVTETINKALN